jgi:predicted secreted protein with PEFG-CTERM motif
MNTRTSYALVAVLAIVGTLSFSTAYGQAGQQAFPGIPADGDIQKAVAKSDRMPLSIKTDKKVYDHNSVIQVTGSVFSPKTDTPVTLTVTSPSNNIVTIQQIMVNSDGTYATTLSTAGNLWKYDGTYVIRVQYGSQSVNNKAQVELTGALMSSKGCAQTEITAKLGSETYCIPYTIEGGATVTEAKINMNDKSIILKINAPADGKLTLNPSSKIIDGIFLVLVDGEEWDDTTINGNEVTIMFPAGAEKIEIIGTFVIPEFGTIAALILVVAIASIIAVSARTRLSIMPRY